MTQPIRIKNADGTYYYPFGEPVDPSQSIKDLELSVNMSSMELAAIVQVVSQNEEMQRSQMYMEIMTMIESIVGGETK